MAVMFYDRDADLNLIKSRKVAVIGFGSQGHAHALNLKDSGVDVRVGLHEGSKSRAVAEAAGLTVASPAAVSEWADVIMVLVPDTSQSQLYTESIAPHLKAGQDADVRARLQHPLRLGRAAEGRRRHDDRAEVARPPRARALRRGRRHAGAPRRPSGRQRAGSRARPVLRQGNRRDARRRDPDDVCRGNRNRPLRRAGRPLRRRQRARQGGLRDAGRGRLSAGDRLLRVPARAEADRRSHLPRRAELHALLGQRHGRARRLHRRPARRQRADQAGAAQDAGRGAGRHLRQGLDGRARCRTPVVRRDAQGRAVASDRTGRRQAARHDAVPRSSQGPAAQDGEGRRRR